VQARRTHGLPFKGYIERIIRNHGFPVEIAFIQADAFAIA